jgi:hypothetical protein
MILALRALPLFQNKFIRSDATLRWPHLLFDKRPIQTATEHWWAPGILAVDRDLPISFTCDRRVVVLHAAGALAGNYLAERDMVFEKELLERMPLHTRMYRHRYVDRDYRVGLKVAETFRKQDPDVQLGMLVDAMVAVADAADELSKWLTLRRGQQLETSPIGPDSEAA